MIANPDQGITGKGHSDQFPSHTENTQQTGIKWNLAMEGWHIVIRKPAEGEGPAAGGVCCPEGFSGVVGSGVLFHCILFYFLGFFI